MCFYFLKYLHQHWGKLSLAAVCLVASVLFQLARPWPLKVVLDYVLLPQPDSGGPLDLLHGYDRMNILLAACGAIVAIAALQGTFQYLQLILAGGAGRQMIYSLRVRLYAHGQRLSLGFHHRHASGDLLSRMIREVTQLRDFLTESAIQWFGDVILVVGLITVMAALDWPMTLLSLVLFPLLFIAIVHFSGKIRGFTRKRVQREGRVASLFSETPAAIQEVQLYSSEDYEQRRLHAGCHRGIDGAAAFAQQARALRRRLGRVETDSLQARTALRHARTLPLPGWG